MLCACVCVRLRACVCVRVCVCRLLQKVESVWTAGPRRLRCGGGTVRVTICVTPADSITRWTGRTALSSNPSGGWYVSTTFLSLLMTFSVSLSVFFPYPGRSRPISCRKLTRQVQVSVFRYYHRNKTAHSLFFIYFLFIFLYDDAIFLFAKEKKKKREQTTTTKRDCDWLVFC